MKLADHYLKIFGAAVILAIIVKNAPGFSAAIRSVANGVNSNAATLASAGTKSYAA